MKHFQLFQKLLLIASFLILNAVCIAQPFQYIQFDTGKKAVYTYEEEDHPDHVKIWREIRPYDFQLYPRDINNQATVTLKGIVGPEPGFFSIVLNVYRTEHNQSEPTEPYFTKEYFLYYQYNSFEFQHNIEAILAEYRFELVLYDHYSNRVISQDIATRVVCGDVYIIYGQSNGLAEIAKRQQQDDAFGGDTDYGKYSRSFGRPQKGAEDYDNTWDQWAISTVLYDKYDIDRLGFVGAWGLKLQHDIQMLHRIPTCFINGSRGSTEIKYFLPEPDSVPDYFEFLKRRVYVSQLQKNIKGIFWWQGETDITKATPMDLYLQKYIELHSHLLMHYTFHKNYIIQICPGYHTVNALPVLEAQRRIPSNLPDVEIIASNGIDYRNGVHFFNEGYNEMSNRLFNLLSRDWYCNAELTTGINSPNIEIAYYDNDNMLVLQFDQEITYHNMNTLAEEIENDLVLNIDPKPSLIEAYISYNKLILSFEGNLPTVIGYHAEKDSEDKIKFIENPYGIGALSFGKIVVGEPPKAGSISFIENLYNISTCTIIESASGFVSGDISENKKAYEVFNCLRCIPDEPVNIRAGSDVTFSAAHLILLGPGFHAHRGCRFGAQVGYDLFAFTANNNCEPLKNQTFLVGAEKSNLNYQDQFQGNTSNIEIFGPDNKFNINVFPNPNMGIFQIGFDNYNESTVTIRIYNQNGIVIAEEVYNSSVNETSIDLSNCPKGVYFIHAFNKSAFIAKEVILI